MQLTHNHTLEQPWSSQWITVCQLVTQLEHLCVPQQHLGDGGLSIMFTH